MSKMIEFPQFAIFFSAWLIFGSQQSSLRKMFKHRIKCAIFCRSHLHRIDCYTLFVWQTDHRIVNATDGLRKKGRSIWSCVRCRLFTLKVYASFALSLSLCLPRSLSSMRIVMKYNIQWSMMQVKIKFLFFIQMRSATRSHFDRN